MDINEDKKLFLALWAFLNKPVVIRILYAALSSFIFAGATNPEFEIIDNFYDGGIVVVAILIIPPYLISKWALPINFSSNKFKNAAFLSIMSVVATMYLLLENEPRHLTEKALLSNSGLLLFWVWAFLFKYQKEKRDRP